MSVRLMLTIAVCLVIRVEPSQDILRKLSLNFAKPLEACKAELGFDESVMQEFFNFWREGYVLSNRQTGCAIICLSSKLELLDGDLKIHHGNAHEFAKKHGADDNMAKQLVDMIHNCDVNTPPSADDPCQKALSVVKCFKEEIHKLDWAPSIDLLVGEVLAEV